MCPLSASPPEISIYLPLRAAASRLSVSAGKPAFRPSVNLRTQLST